MESLLDRYRKNTQMHDAMTIIDGTDIVTTKTVALNKNQNVKKVPFSCFACFETFTVEVDFTKMNSMDKNVPVEFYVVCQSCGLKGEVSIQKDGSWSCEYCGKIFPTKKEAETHEENCACNKQRVSL